MRDLLALSLGLFLAVAGAALPGCSSAAGRRESPERAGGGGEAPASGPGGFSAVGAALPRRVLVKTASLDLESDDPGALALAAEKIAADAGGYAQSSSADDRGVSLTLRVPADRLDGALARLEKLGDVKSRAISAEDETETYVDLDARVKNLCAVRDRLKKHVEETRGIQDVVQLENALGAVQGEIDAIEARLERLRSTAALSQVALRAERPRILGPLGYMAYGLWFVASKLFVIR
ncbi:MAG TPA: DUF4349 domain-containing protein [Planctomycetota bacterium]|nr:DUF4349 domain-containing protein [Planctomycetota bacterium]